ncbi:formate dehydrogenase accessory sulfurtransferase FdhD [Flavimarina sp. Hel_I_48]|uniref:formate dehydrogenase accessory sulfurtransferase FdhD n=1 Tax=Flavimarina sp. Hel_I_48 TaxID=1392488 RepID=UPI001F137DB7|nr:formate dehydrogenase accessory sulfurtransferase FdhD [Flavimarina sp. Hel_I_48]
MKESQESSVFRKEIVKVKASEIQYTTDTLAVEEPFEISISVLKATPPIFNKNISITMRTPGHDADLAVGFLFTEGILSTPEQVEQVLVSENKVNVFLRNSETLDLSQLERHFYTSSSCGVCGKSSIDAIKTVCQLDLNPKPLKVDPELIKTFPAILRARQEVFDKTGGLHAAVLFDIHGNLLDLREDVGRHNALDKLLGASFKANNLPLDDKLLLLSGRASFELIQKASMAGIQVVMAVGAPSSLAVKLAMEFNMTLIGFLYENRYNIYCGQERILAEHAVEMDH